MNRYEKNCLIILRNEIMVRIILYKVQDMIKDGLTEMAAINKLSYYQTLIYYIKRLKI